MQLRFTASLLALLGCAQGADTLEDGELPPQQQDEALYVDPGPILNVIAHEDDDLGFMNLSQDLKAGRQVVSLYLTAGDAAFGAGPNGNDPPPCQVYFEKREEGMMRAYEQALGLPVQTWSAPTDAITVTLATGVTRKIRRRVLPGGQVTLLFLGLGNNELGSGKLLVNLWDGNAPAGYVYGTVPDTRRGATGVETYTREQAILAVLRVMEQYQPRHINTLDSARIWPVDFPFDHPDHVGSALIALAAKQRFTAVGGPTTLRIQRSYNSALEADNVSSADVAARRAIFKAYLPNDAKICPPGVSGFVNVCANSSPAVNDPQLCDDPVGTYEPFDESCYTNIPVQGAGGSIHGPGNRCLQSSASALGGVLSLQTCNPASPTQKWDLLKTDQLRLRGTNLCASANVAPGARGVSSTLQTCNGADRNQRFLLTTDTKLRGPDASCIEVSNDTTLTIRECSGAASQLDWFLQVSSPVGTALASGVSDAEIQPNQAYYAALSLADLNDDGRADLCERRSSGIWCALASAGGPIAFAPFTQWSSAFTDAQGWNAASWGSTVQLAHLNPDGKAEICGRKSDGIYCATNTGASFTNYSRRSTNFSDAEGFSAAAKYLSLRLVDLDKDGGADVCARNANGIACALNGNPGAATPQFAPATQWLSTEFTDALGWNTSNAGSTLQFADIDGDQRADVCGRGAAGIRCALQNAAHKFDNEHLWSDTDDFSNAAGWSLNESYYRSIRLVDLNGDGRADVCGRGYDGVVCGLSTGAAFSAQKPLLTLTPFSDPEGWDPAKYGSTLKFADLDADGRADLCARGPIPGGGVGVRCALGPVPAL